MSRRPAWWLPVLARIWPITWMSAKATTWPVVGGLIARLTLPLFSGKNLDVSYIPINETLTPPGSTPLPVAVVEELIRRSAHRVIIDKCTCRDARRCEEHPVEMGCTLLGEGTREIDPRIARGLAVEYSRTLRGESVQLTAREREVLKLLAEGLSNRAIADRLVLAESTVKGHVATLRQKLQATSRLHAVVQADRHGLL